MMLFITLFATVSGVLSTGVLARMRGFDGEYEITCPDEIIEIRIRFRTPPSGMLRWMYDSGIPMPSDFKDSMTFDEYALMAHARFYQQLSRIINSDEYEIFDEDHIYRNEVFMRVRGGFVESIAELHEVFEITPADFLGDGIPFSPPLPPFVSGTPTANSIAISTVNFYGEGFGVEYRIETPVVGSWQLSPVFIGLAPDTGYAFQARFVFMDVDGTLPFPPASLASLPSEIIRTAPSPKWTVTFNLNGGNNTNNYIHS